MANLLCHHCQKENEFSALSAIGRRDACKHCGNDLHCCLNCVHYDASAQWECREHIHEAVRNKDRSNFCDLFRAREKEQAGETKKTEGSKEDLLNLARALFKK